MSSVARSQTSLPFRSQQAAGTAGTMTTIAVQVAELPAPSVAANSIVCAPRGMTAGGAPPSTRAMLMMGVVQASVAATTAPFPIRAALSAGIPFTWVLFTNCGGLLAGQVMTGGSK